MCLKCQCLCPDLIPKEKKQTPNPTTKTSQNQNKLRENFETQKTNQGTIKQVVYWVLPFFLIKALQILLMLMYTFSKQLVVYVTLRCNHNYYGAKETKVLCAKLARQYFFKATC